jgi:hypothetical protein
VKPASIANELFHLPVYVLTSGYPLDRPAKHPEDRFPAAISTFPVSIQWFQEPNAVFKPESPIGEGSNRAYINHIP